MLLKSLALLLIAVAIVAAQDAAEQPVTRTRTAASRRTKLFEESQQQQAEKVTAAGQRRRLVSKTKVNPAATRISQPTTAAPTTTTAAPTTTEPVTEPVFQEPEPTIEEEQSVEVEQEPEVATFRPRPAVPARTVTQDAPSELPAFRPRSRPAGRPVIIEEEVEEEIAPPVRQRPVAGPTRTRTQAAAPVQQVSRPQVQVLVAEEAPVLLSKDGKLPRTRTSAKASEEPKAPVETIRRYNFENEDGSFTFGYENADGSFKEETRGVDCIVRGKYGYIDPDGIKREFSYQTGNQCVPGQKNEEEELEDEEEEERPIPARRPNVPARRPNVPTERRPNVPAVERRPVNIVQQQQNEDDAEDEIAQVLNTPTRITRPNNAPVTPQRVQQQQPARRPAQQSSFDFDSEVGRVSSQPQPQPQQRPVAPPARPIFNDADDDDVFIERRPIPPAPLTGTGLRSFSTELIFDRNSNQFQSALQQRIPETNEEISIRERLGGFVFNPQTTTTPAPFTIQRVAPQTVQRPQQSEQQFSSVPVVSDAERLRQLQEIRRAELEQQRLSEERQRIQEENRQAQQQPAVVFGAPPRTQPQQFQQQPQQVQFRAPQPQFQFRPQTVPQGGAPTFASGQIDSFLSSLG